MIRLRVVTSCHSDQDVESQLPTLEHLPRVSVTYSDAPLEDNLALIARQSFRMYFEREPIDVVVSVGEPALVATMLGWRGPIIHLPDGALTKTESRLLRWKRTGSSGAIVVSTQSAAQHAIGHGISPALVRVIRTIPDSAAPPREKVRATLGIDPDANCVLIGGRIRGIGEQRIALWAAAILAFRDARWRILVDPGDYADYVRRFATNTFPAGSLILCRGVSVSELTAAADVVLIDGEAIPSFVAIASAARHRVPIVASRSLWQREQLDTVPAKRVVVSKARDFARAVLEVMDARKSIDLPSASEHIANIHQPAIITRQWLEVLQTVSGRRKDVDASAIEHE